MIPIKAFATEIASGIEYTFKEAVGATLPYLGFKQKYEAQVVKYGALSEAFLELEELRKSQRQEEYKRVVAFYEDQPSPFPDILGGVGEWFDGIAKWFEEAGTIAIVVAVVLVVLFGVFMAVS